jgi:gamma-glutamylcyclotransferase (GGCT)/AIG2-like uncharacterized protein YtfP
MKYFGYGSNLNRRHWKEWCVQHGFADADMAPVGHGYLIDHQLVFPRRSFGWRGGVLGMVPLAGAVVEGMLFDVTVEQLEALDLKEGVSFGAYDRIMVKVQTETGDLVEAITYFARSEGLNKQVPPSPAYLQTVAEGFETWGLPLADVLSAADAWPTLPNVSHIAVYGTLRMGGSRGQVLDDHAVERLACTLDGVLIDFGDYPGLARTTSPLDKVIAEAVVIRDMRKAIEICDSIEGFSLPGCPYNLFERRLTNIHTACGETIRSWYYQFSKVVRDATFVNGGDWMAAYKNSGRQIRSEASF